MQKIYSKFRADQLLHVLVNTHDTFYNRIDLSPEEEYLQLSLISLPQSKTIKPHIHNPRSDVLPRISAITQECWIVLRGSIKVRLFDLDSSLLEGKVLTPGWVLVTFHGGHALECLEDNTLVIECKNGPYQGKDYTLLE
jgi:hypothetical protein